MIRLLINSAITAAFFCFVCPELASGVQFHGDFFPTAILYGAAFGVVSWLVGFAILAAEASFAVATRGLGLLVLIPLNLFFYWLLPAIQIEAMAHFFPQHFTVTSWGAAIWAGLLLLVVNFLTRPTAKKVA